MKNVKISAICNQKGGVTNVKLSIMESPSLKCSSYGGNQGKDFTYAGFLLANGMSMKEVQDWLGHSTFKITADTYAHLDFKSKLNSADALSFGTAFAKIPQ